MGGWQLDNFAPVCKCIVKRHHESDRSLWEYSPTGRIQLHFKVFWKKFNFFSFCLKKKKIIISLCSLWEVSVVLDDVTVVVRWSHVGTADTAKENFAPGFSVTHPPFLLCSFSFMLYSLNVRSYVDYILTLLLPGLSSIMIWFPHHEPLSYLLPPSLVQNTHAFPPSLFVSHSCISSILPSFFMWLSPPHSCLTTDRVLTTAL